MNEEFFRLFIAVMIFAISTTYFHIQIRNPKYNWLSYFTLGFSLFSYVTAFIMLVFAINYLR